MDPAGPGFQRMNTDMKLESTDAKYVQCIHTNDFYGMRANVTDYKCGDAIFIINNGSLQGGCFEEREYPCHHERAHLLFRESLSPDSKFWGIPCRESDGLPYKNETIAVMGIHGQSHGHGTKGRFCVPTNYKPPYALDKEIVAESFWNRVTGFDEFFVKTANLG